MNLGHASEGRGGNWKPKLPHLIGPGAKHHPRLQGYKSVSGARSDLGDTHEWPGCGWYLNGLRLCYYLAAH